jgi:hypothetical protein
MEGGGLVAALLGLDRELVGMKPNKCLPATSQKLQDKMAV